MAKEKLLNSISEKIQASNIESNRLVSQEIRRILIIVICIAGLLMSIVGIGLFSGPIDIIQTKVDSILEEKVDKKANQLMKLAKNATKEILDAKTDISRMQKEVRVMKEGVDTLSVKFAETCDDIDSPKVTLLLEEMKILKDDILEISSTIEKLNMDVFEQKIKNLYNILEISPEKAVSLPLLRMELSGIEKRLIEKYSELNDKILRYESRYNYFIVTFLTVVIGTVGALIGQFLIGKRQSQIVQDERNEKIINELKAIIENGEE